jgi:histidinol dehydrogenase
MKCPLRWGTDEANREVLTSLISASRTFGDAEEAVLAIVGEFRDSGSLSMLGEVGEVKEKNDKALLRFTEKFDGVALRPDRIEISDDEMSEALASLESGIREALELAAGRIRAFHESTLPSEIVSEPGPGERLALRPSPLRSVGLYVPGGTAAYPSTLLMGALAAKAAGVEEVVVCTPPGRDGSVPASVLAAAAIAGVDKMFRVGGAQAIAAMAFGTASIPKVDKIAGPGNVFVAAAKRLVRDTVDIDKDAGPSEVVVVIADAANADWAAADMIAQAEHDEDAMAVGVVVGARAASALANAVERLLADEDLDGRGGIIGRALGNRGAIFEVKNLDEALEAVEILAPEHLELMIEDAEAFAGKVRNAGAIFCGPWGTAPLGDYVAGTNHVLPTGRAARFASPLGVLDFIKWTSVVSFTEEGAGPLIEPAARLADLEGLPAHARALRLRRKDNT